MQEALLVYKDPEVVKGTNEMMSSRTTSKVSAASLPNTAVLSLKTLQVTLSRLKLDLSTNVPLIREISTSILENVHHLEPGALFDEWSRSASHTTIKVEDASCRASSVHESKDPASALSEDKNKYWRSCRGPEMQR